MSLRAASPWHAALALALALVGVSSAHEPVAPLPKDSNPADRIAFYQQHVDQHPKHYPAYARLGRAWLDEAKRTYDPAALAKARASLRRSLEILANYEALHGLAATANHAHRFEEALDWCRQAAAADPDDKSVVAMQVEALLGLGRMDDARAAIGESVKADSNFYLAAALGHWHLAQEQSEKAAARFLEAARLAQGERAPSLAVWATVMSAGVWLDGGDLQRAKPLLESATRLDDADPFLRIHWAELAEAENRLAESLKIYDALLKEQASPELHRRAFGLARRLNKPDLAAEHFQAARKLGQRALDAGEIYSLETLANLYCDAGKERDLALRLAERNYQGKRDESARNTLARARAP